MLCLRAPRLAAALVLFACVGLGGCDRGGVEQVAAALDQPVEPPIPCAIVTGPEEAQTLSQLEIKDGRVVRVVTRAEQREGQITWEHKLSYDDAGHLSSVDKAVASAEVGVGLRAVTRFGYDDAGRLSESSYKDPLGRTHVQRWTYAGDATRPESAEILVGERSVEQLRYDYEGAPTWTGALFLPGPRFGAATLHTRAGEAGEEKVSQTMRFDPQTGALVELVHADGRSERYLYGDECQG